jgi:hypothetical protein
MELSSDEPSPRRAPGAPPFLDPPSPGDGGGGGGGGGRVPFLARVANISPADDLAVDATERLGADGDLVCGDVTLAEFRAIKGSAWLCGSAIEALCAMINHVYSSHGGRKRIRVYGGLFLAGNANALGENLDRVPVTRSRPAAIDPFLHLTLRYYGLRARRALSCARMFPPVVSHSATRPSCCVCWVDLATRVSIEAKDNVRAGGAT